MDDDTNEVFCIGSDDELGFEDDDDSHDCTLATDVAMNDAVTGHVEPATTSPCPATDFELSSPAAMYE
uniref:Uncharacterized protein n=1 Tax=Amphimedon queenslandica TaxID=400682 RepID=A0A1X7T2Q6_AMPQE